MTRSVLALAGVLLCWPSNRTAESQAVPVATRAAGAVSGEWTVIHTEGETGCAFGTPFRFFHREGPDSSKLMVYFQGGGACWNWVSCSGMFDTSVVDDELAQYRGIFDFSNPGNPFRDYSIVFVPYCTGDVHVGDTVAQYGDDAWGAPPVEHRGYTNVTAVLDWVEDHLPQPERVVVTGASAGSYGALFHAPSVALLFPSAELIVIGDSGVPLLHDYSRILEQWGAGRRLRTHWGFTKEPGGAEITLEGAHEHLVRLRPEATVAQITTDRDAVQRAFYIFSGSPNSREITLTLLQTLEERIPSFRAFVLSGEQHGLMRADWFYLLDVNGVLLRDWIDDLVQRRPVVSRYCTACE